MDPIYLLREETPRITMRFRYVFPVAAWICPWLGEIKPSVKLFVSLAFWELLSLKICFV